MAFAVEKWNCISGLADPPVYDTASGEVRRFFEQKAETIFIHHVPTSGPMGPYVETAILGPSDILRGQPFRYHRRVP
jgi:hypothetical protein